MDQKSQARRFAELHTLVLSSNGYQIFLRLSGFYQTLRIFRSNYTDLEAAITRRTVEYGIVDVRDSKKGLQADAALFDVLRHLHNTVAAALSLIDHTRVFFNTYYENPLLIPDYQGQIDTRFKSDGLSQFVKCLRQFCQHYRTPEVSAFMEFNRGQIDISVVLTKTDLNEFGSWTAPAKTYLNALPDRINLKMVMQSYYDHIHEFYQWFDHRLRELHQADLDHYNEMVAESEAIRTQDPFYKNYQSE